MLKGGFKVHNEVHLPHTPDPMASHTPNSATWTSTVTWEPTVELLGNILTWWPLQALAFVAKFQAEVLTNGAYWQDGGQLSQGIDLHSSLQGIPESVLMILKSMRLCQKP